MRDDAGVRRRYRPVERARLLRKFRAGGWTQREFAARVGISLSCLSRWLRWEDGAEIGEPPAFLEIPAVPGAGLKGYRLEAPGGVVLEVPRSFSSGEVRELWRLAREL